MSLLLLALLLPAGYEDPPKADLDKIQGTWAVSRTELNGKPQPKDPLFAVKVMFESDKLSAKVGKRDPIPRGTVKLDPTQTPNAYDLTTPEGAKVLGIYQLDGDTLKVCLGAPGDDRPMTFTTEPDDGRTLLIYQRDKPAKGR